MFALRIIFVFMALTIGFTSAAGRELGENTIDEFLWGPEVLLVTATREAEHPFEAPATVVSIFAEMIRERGYRDITDILQDIPGFDLSTNVYGEFSTLVAQRGIGGNNKIVILLDGEEITFLSSKQFPFGHNLPISLAKRIEIVYGPASALYGPNAFGVINIITREAHEVDGLDVTVAGGTYKTYDTSLLFGKLFGDKLKIKAYGRIYGTDGQDLSKEYADYSYIRSYPGGLVRNRMEAPVRDWNLVAKAEINNLTLNITHSTFKEQLSKGLDPTQYVYNKEAFWGQRMTDLSLKHVYSTQRFQFTSHAAFDVYEIDPEMNWYYLMQDDLTKEFSTLKVHQYGKTNRTTLDFQANYHASDKLKLSGGFVYEDITGLGVGDVYGEPFDRNKPLLINNYNIPQAVVSSQNYGFYGQLKWQITSRLKAIAGARYDYNTIYKDTFNPRIGLVHSQPDKQSVKLLFGTAFIAPSYFHRYETWFVEEYGHIQNPNLKPETMRTWELNWTRSWSKKLQSSLSLYFNDVHNLIVRRYYGMFPMTDPFVDTSGDGQVFVEWNDNFGHIHTYGADLRFDYIPSPNFKAYFNYSFIDGYSSDPNTGEYLDLFKTSTHKSMAGLTWYPQDRLSISPRLRWVSKIATYRENSMYQGSRMPGYYLVNLHARIYELFPNTELFVTVNNLLNKHYYTPGVSSESTVYLPRVPQNLRSVVIGFSYWPSFKRGADLQPE